MESPDLEEVIKRSWNDPSGGKDAMDNFARKMRHLRKGLRRWEKEKFGSIKQKEEDLQRQIVKLEEKEELE